MSAVMRRQTWPEPDCKVGDRIQLTAMGADPCPIKPGALGTVAKMTHWGDGSWQVTVQWDNHRSLHLVWPIDTFEVIARQAVLIYEGEPT